MLLDLLDKLKHVSSAGILALDEDGCMKGTRVSLLNDLHQWSMDVTAPPIFWLDGMAGTGKSAIAREFCRSLHETKRLGGSFFCLRGHESRANVKRILPTLSWFLARQNLQYQMTLLEILRDEPDVADYAIKRQLEFLLEKPLLPGSVDQQCTPPLVLSIDALDECADAEEVKQLLNKLLDVSKDLPLKFFLTSRPERHIVAHFQSSHSEIHRILRLHDIEQDIVEADILLYLNGQLRNIRLANSPSMFPAGWPALKDVHILTRLSGKLFIYAFTAVNFIAARNHAERLQTLTRLTVDNCQPHHGPLDKMYSLVLSAALDPDECTLEEICMTKRILGTIIAIREPLRLSDLAKLLVVAPVDIWANTDRIRAIVNVPPSGEDGVVSTFHTSFVDFLTTERAPEKMRIRLSAAHRDLADGCLKTMISDLHFNIANCKTSYLLNSEQPLATISAPLKYASLHWAHHIDASYDGTSLLPLLENFLFERFLFWLEVLSVSGLCYRASSILLRALSSDTVVSDNFVRIFIVP